MPVTVPRKPGRRPIDKLTEVRRYKYTPDEACPSCGQPMYAVRTTDSIRYLKCRACGETGKEAR